MNVQELAKDKRFAAHILDGDIVDWSCSTGSLMMDVFLDGGFHPGVFRLTGEFESGKTSFSLNCARLFQLQVKNAFVVYVNAEGRFTPEKIAQSGIDVDPAKFYCLDCNIADVVYEFMKTLITENEEGKRYLFIIDSVDALQRLSDADKAMTECEKVAGGALINSTMGKKMSLPLHKNGHCAFILSQVRVDLSTASSYTGPQDKPSGGKALNHYASLVAVIKNKYNSDYIWENATAKTAADRGKPIGHYATFKFIKTRNEKTLESVVVPIKHGRKNGASIWSEYEFYQLAVQWDLIKVKGAWFNFNENFIKDVTDAKIEIQESHQGERNLIAYLEANPKVVEFGLAKFRTLMTSTDQGEKPANKEKAGKKK